MRAVLRLGMAIATVGLWLGQAPVLAQSAPAATTNTPASDSIGPRELQNFSLDGNVTRPVEQAPPARAPAPRAHAPQPPQAATPTSTGQAPAVRTARAQQQPEASPQPSAATAELPSPPAREATEAAPATASVGLPAATVEAPANITAERSPAIWLWLLAALALGAGGAFLYWRRSSREAYASGPPVEAFIAPQPRAPEPPPAAPAPPLPTGFVSTRMRPSIEMVFRPIRCVVGEQVVGFDFELELFNSGNVPARDVLIEVGVFNASPTQDEEIRAFFINGGQGERVADIGPHQRISLRPELAVPVDQLRVLEAAGRRVFVPLIAFNARYRGGSTGGHTAGAYLLGRDTKGEKLAPFRLDLGARIFRGLAARALPLSVRS